jgi:hypothetical protein
MSVSLTFLYVICSSFDTYSTDGRFTAYSHQLMSAQHHGRIKSSDLVRHYKYSRYSTTEISYYPGSESVNHKSLGRVVGLLVGTADMNAPKENRTLSYRDTAAWPGRDSSKIFSSKTVQNYSVQSQGTSMTTGSIRREYSTREHILSGHCYVGTCASVIRSKIVMAHRLWADDFVTFKHTEDPHVDR